MTTTANPTPASLAEDIFRDSGDLLGPRPLFVLEGGYFDAREGRAADRAVQLLASFALGRKLADLAASPVATVHTLLVNDVEPSPSECDDLSDSCSGQRREHDGTPAWAAELYQAHLGETWPDKVKHFTLRNARNRFARNLNRAGKGDRRASPLHEELIVEQQVARDTVGIMAETDRGQFFLGYRKDDGFTISLKCVGLMAQHYHDLYDYGLTAHPGSTSVWIFDWLREEEQFRVAQGIDLAFQLFDWDDRSPPHVVNCVYAGHQPRTVSVRHKTGVGR